MCICATEKCCAKVRPDESSLEHGRGVKTQSELSSPTPTMLKIKEITNLFREEVELVMTHTDKTN